MSEFKVGEVAIIVGTFSGRTDVIGMECTVVDTAFCGVTTSGKVRNGVLIKPHGDWVDGGNTGHIVVGHNHLRKKRQPEEQTTWQAVQSITGWTPHGVPA